MADTTHPDDKKRSSITQRFRESLKRMGSTPTEAKGGSLSARTPRPGLKGLTRRHSTTPSDPGEPLEGKVALDSGKPAAHDPKAEVAIAADEHHSIAHVKVTAIREEDGAKFSPQSAAATTGTASLPASPQSAAATPVAAAAEPPPAAATAAAALPRTPEVVQPRTPELQAAAQAAAETAGGLDLQQLLQEAGGPVPVVDTPPAAAAEVQVDPQPVRRKQRGRSLLARAQLLGIAVVAGALSAAAFESSRNERAPRK